MTGNTLRVATYNAASIRSRLDQISGWLRMYSPDVLCVQETKVQDADFPLDFIRETGYHVAFRGQKAHAGVAIISRTEPEDVSWGLDDGGPPDDARLIRAVIRDIPIINTYVPQGQSIDSERFQYKLEWFERLRAWFPRHYSPEQPVLWAGDFNVATEEIDVHDPKRLVTHVDFHPLARAALEGVRAWGFVDVFRLHHPGEPEQYTYYDYRVRDAIERKVGWRVDHIWATEPLARKATASWIDVEARRAARPSDHTFLVAEFAL